MRYPVARKEYPRLISIHRKCIFLLWAILGGLLVCATPRSIVLPLTLWEVLGFLFSYGLYGLFVWYTYRNQIAPRVLLLKTLEFGGDALIVRNHRGRPLAEIRYGRFTAIEVRWIKTDWAGVRNKAYFMTERYILLYHDGASSFADLEALRLDLEGCGEVYSTMKLFSHPDCIACMYSEELLRRISEALPVRKIFWA